MMHLELNCRNRSFGWDASLKFCYTFFSLCTVIVIGVNKVDKGIGDKGIVRIKILRRSGERGRVRTHSDAYRRTIVSWRTSKTAYIATKIKIPNKELKYHGQSTVNI